MVVQLPFTLVQSHFQVLSVPFDTAAQLSYRQSVANASGLSLDEVKIGSITAVDGGIAVETLILVAAVPPRLTTENLNANLVAVGLPPAIMLTPPAVAMVPILTSVTVGVVCMAVCTGFEWVWKEG